jgi:predicted ATP-dependent endonuclease of OLD family
MRLVEFRVQMYRSIIDSSWVKVNPLTVVVGKNESGKTTLLEALHKLKPFSPEPYSMDSEWPRGRRQDRNPKQVVCTGRFTFTPKELDELEALMSTRPSNDAVVEVARTYDGTVNVAFPKGFFPGRLTEAEVTKHVAANVPAPGEPCGASFRAAAKPLREAVSALARTDRFSEITQLSAEHVAKLKASLSMDGAPERAAEDLFLSQYAGHLAGLMNALKAQTTLSPRTDWMVQQWLPTFIYMSDYRAFTGTARLEQVQQRKGANLTEEDKTLLMIMSLSGLNLDQEVQKGNDSEREQRQYDLDDASATLTRTISERWKQRKYEVQFRADGQLFYTFVKDERDPSLIRLEERSKGFQWFFSFDLMFMHESGGTFKNCVLLLDEPGLHLHPDAQRDLLRRLEAYAEGNVLIYSTHLPFMIDLRQPARIRVMSETEQGNAVSDDLSQSQPEGKLVLQAALGMSASASWLVAERNLVVEGVDDHWIVTELSNLMIRSAEDGLPDDVLVTPAGGASEAAYIATLMIGQKLKVVVLLDTDRAGEDARDGLVKRWLTRYQDHHAEVLSLGPTLGIKDRDFAIEDLFPDDYYRSLVEEVCAKQLELAGISTLTLIGTDMLCKRVERAMAALRMTFNKGSVATALRHRLRRMKTFAELPKETQERGRTLIAGINKTFEKMVKHDDGRSDREHATSSDAGRLPKPGESK